MLHSRVLQGLQLCCRRKQPFSPLTCSLPPPCASGPEHDSGLLPRSLSVIFSSIEGRVYPRSDLKPQRCRDFTRLTAEQQAAESSSKRSLLRLLKEVLILLILCTNTAHTVY